MQGHQPSAICPVLASVAPKYVWRPGSGYIYSAPPDSVAGFRGEDGAREDMEMKDRGKGTGEAERGVEERIGKGREGKGRW